MTEAIGNEEQMAQVREAMRMKELADEVNAGDKALDVVDIDFTSEESGKHYTGKIVFKRPNVMQSLSLGGRKTQLLKEAGVVDKELADDGVLMMAQAISTLEVVVEKCPEWFLDITKVEEADLIFHVYGRYTLWDYSFRLKNNPALAGDSKATK